MEIRPRHRERDIFGAAFVHAPSYSGPEVWTVAEGVAVRGKPKLEHLEIARARNEYDRGIKTLHAYGRALVGGLVLNAGDSPAEFARAVEAGGAPVRSVVNAWNLARLARNEGTADLYLVDREWILREAGRGSLAAHLEAKSE